MILLYEKKTDFFYLEKKYNSAIYYVPLCKKKLFSDRYLIENNGEFAKCLIKDSDCRITIDWFERTSDEITNTHLLSTGFLVTDNGLDSIKKLINNNK